jgi:hypothetical protein
MASLSSRAASPERRRAGGFVNVPATVKAVLESVLRVFWLRQPDELRVGVLPVRRALVRAEVERARDLLAAAKSAQPGEPQNLLGAQALRTLLAAVAVAGSDADDLEASFAVSVRAGSLRVAATLEGGPLSEVLAAFGETERPPPNEKMAFAGLVELHEWTAALLDLRSDRETQLLRASRWGVLGAALVCAAWALLGTKNLARGKPVTASSVCRYTPDAPLGKDRLSRVVDGIRAEGRIAHGEWVHGTFALCTDTQVHPWVTVDLGAVRKLHEVVVYNRSDCCWGLDDIPLELQVSVDNQTFTTVATTKNPFMDDFPWRVRLRRRPARYVRIYNPSDTPKNIVINELEAYGR